MEVLKSKIHRAIVTDHNLEYEGSLTIDPALIERAGLYPNEKIAVWNVTNGNRFQTYVMVGRRGSGDMCINGAAAHLAQKGDVIIVAAYGIIEAAEAAGFVPRIVRVDSANQVLADAGPERLP